MLRSQLCLRPDPRLFLSLTDEHFPGMNFPMIWLVSEFVSLCAY